MDINKLNALVALGGLPPDAQEFIKEMMRSSNLIVNCGDNTHIHIGTKIQYGSAPQNRSGSSSSSDATKLPEVSSGRSYAPPSSANEQPASKVGGSVARRPVSEEPAPVPFVTDSVLDILSTDEE
jgi:hypothetical protein